LFACLLVSCRGDQTQTETNATWKVGPAAGSLDLLAVSFVDSKTGWAVGDIDPSGTGGVVYQTSDGGVAWLPIARTTEVLASVHFVSATLGWAAGYAGRISRTDDGGHTWRNQRTEHEGEILNSIFFIDGETGWAVGGSGLVLRTTDGGSHWYVSTTGRVEDLWSVRFSSRDRGRIVGEQGLILGSEDGGQSWSQRPSGTLETLYGVALLPSGIAVAVGEGGTILRSEDGQTFVAVDGGTRETLNGIAAGGASRLWAVGSKGATIGSGDGGLTWQAAIPVVKGDLLSIDLGDVSHGAAVGRRGVTQRLD
jgi:photosystem II stability/assembly factor-like uncharacterized protein